MTISPGTLFVVATPIGHLGDWSFRAVECIKHADRVLCEDTRVSRVLLEHYGIKKTLHACHDHNEATQVEKYMALLEEGQNIALMSDAGTPLISDPGFRLVREARARNFPVVAVPGASSVTAALSIAGLPADRFFFAGFLPSKQEARKKEIKALQAIPATLVFFESPNRIMAALADLLEILGPREAAVARELTKRHEEVLRGTLEALPALLPEEKQRGEMVILVAPAEEIAADEPAIAHVLSVLLKEHSVKDAARLAADITGAPRNAVYDMALRLKQHAEQK